MRSYKMLNGLQGLRGIAFLCVFFSHVGMNINGIGAWGVSVFLIMSGFVMIYSYLAREKEAGGCIYFAWQKIRNLYPLHILMLLFAAIYDAFFLRPGLLTFGAKVALHATMLQAWVPIPALYATLNYPTWYLCVCVFCYALFPLLLKLMRKMKKERTAYFIIAALLCSQLVIAGFGHLLTRSTQQNFLTKWFVYYFPASRFLDFAIGCCIGYLFVKKEPIKVGRLSSTINEVLVCSLIVLSIFLSAKGVIPEAFQYVLLFTPTTIALIWLIANENGLLSKVLTWKPLVSWGGLSQFAFLIHVMVLALVKRLDKMLLGNFNNQIITIGVSLLITFAASVLWKKYFAERIKRVKIDKTK